MTKKIVAVMGSPNIGRNTDSMVTATVRGMREAGAEVMEVRLRDYTFRGCQSCGGCLRDGICKQNDDMQKIYPLIQYSDGLVLASPTYNYNITAEMKAFVDRLFCYYDFAGPSGWGCRLGYDRKALVLAQCAGPGEPGMQMTLDAMRMPLEALGYRVVRTVSYCNARRQPVAQNHGFCQELTYLGREFVLHSDREEEQEQGSGKDTIIS